MIRLQRLVFFSLIMLLVLSGCAQATEAVDNPYPYPYPGGQMPAPVPQEQNGSSEYPWPGSPEQPLAAVSLQIPEPEADSAVIVGILLEKGEPIFNATIYLAEVLQDSDTGEFQVASYSRERSPRAAVDQNGQFLFTDVKPGKYSLILDNFSNYFSLNEPAAADQPLIFSAEAGQTIDLGKLDYEDLPEL